MNDILRGAVGRIEGKMSGYLSDWLAWEEQARRAREANPECTGRKDCPAPDDGHVLSCGRFRRLVHPELYAKIDREAEERRQPR